MTNKYCDSPIHKCLCLFLALIFFITIVLSVPAAADSVRPNEPVGWKDGDTFRDILLAVLDGWGISFSRSDPDDETSILEYSDQLMQQFYDANQTTQELFWDAVKFGASETGNIILDFLGVTKLMQFGEWLVDRFDLVNNSSTSEVLSQTYYIGSVPLVQLPNSNSYYKGYRLTFGSSSSFPVYIMPARVKSGNSTGNVAIVFSKSYVSGSLISVYDSSNTRVYQASMRYSDSSISFAYANTLYDFFFSDIDPSTAPYYSSYSALESFLISNPISIQPTYSNFVINTTVINIPSENDISPDEGLQIEVPGTNWGDSIYTILNIIERLIGLYDSTQLNINTVIDLISTLLQGLQKSVSVENIPGAVVLDYDEYDIPLETEWSLVDGFFSEETEGSPFSTLTTILYGFPEPFVIFFSVIVVFVVAYGFIRLGRDSH